jgi:hypothetical protein
MLVVNLYLRSVGFKCIRLTGLNNTVVLDVRCFVCIEVVVCITKYALILSCVDIDTAAVPLCPPRTHRLVVGGSPDALANASLICVLG